MVDDESNSRGHNTRSKSLFLRDEVAQGLSRGCYSHLLWCPSLGLWYRSRRVTHHGHATEQQIEYEVAGSVQDVAVHLKSPKLSLNKITYLIHMFALNH